MKKFKFICGTIHTALKNHTKNETRLTFYKKVAVLTLSYGSEM